MIDDDKHPVHPEDRVQGQEYVSEKGIRVTKVGNQEYLNLEDMQRYLCTEIEKMPRETRPNVLAAQDARDIINTLTLGIGGDMDKLRKDSATFLTEIRQTKFAIVSEVNGMTGPLKELRQFFLGSDYKEQIERLKEFVDLCERLQKLKQAGMLDAVADTMLKLA